MPQDQIIDAQGSAPAASCLFASRLRLLRGRPLSSVAGFTLVELIIVVGIIGIISTFALPTFNAFVDRAKSARAKQEVRLLETEINDYQVQNGTLPPDLTAINRGALNDPWGHLYVYSTTPARKRFASILNNDFDLCSKGKDGLTEAEVFGGGGTGKDDILRGGSGVFVGLGADW